jgi:hypothetical protein
MPRRFFPGGNAEAQVAGCGAGAAPMESNALAKPSSASMPTAIYAERAGAECNYIEQPAGQAQILVEVNHAVIGDCLIS